MSVITIADFRKNLAEVLNRVAYNGERVALQRSTRPVAVIVSLEDAAILRAIEDREDVKAARKALREKGPRLTLAQLKKELGL